MNEKTPLLYNYKLKQKKEIIEKSKIICKHKYHKEVIEIITNHYNLNYYFDISATNCKQITKIGTTVFGIILIINKKNIDKPSVISWKMLKG